MLIQITAAQGPDECARAVYLALQAFCDEAQRTGLSTSLLEQEAGAKSGTYQSVLVALEGDGAENFITDWHGSIQWTCPSPYRPRHKRKNWFIGVNRFERPSIESDMQIRYESCRASGPGGQHVNKTDSAIRATHITSGLSVKVQSERSQHANKRLAQQLITLKLQQAAEQSQADARTRQRDQHLQLERGNPVRVYKGENFVRVR